MTSSSVSKKRKSSCRDIPILQSRKTSRSSASKPNPEWTDSNSGIRPAYIIEISDDEDGEALPSLLGVDTAATKEQLTVGIVAVPEVTIASLPTHKSSPINSPGAKFAIEEAQPISLNPVVNAAVTSPHTPQPLENTSLRAGITTTNASHASPANVGTQNTVHGPNFAVSRALSTIERSPFGSSMKLLPPFPEFRRAPRTANLIAAPSPSSGIGAATTGPPPTRIPWQCITPTGLPPGWYVLPAGYGGVYFWHHMTRRRQPDPPAETVMAQLKRYIEANTQGLSFAVQFTERVESARKGRMIYLVTQPDPGLQDRKPAPTMLVPTVASTDPTKTLHSEHVHPTTTPPIGTTPIQLHPDLLKANISTRYVNLNDQIFFYRKWKGSAWIHKIPFVVSKGDLTAPLIDIQESARIMGNATEAEYLAQEASRAAATAKMMSAMNIPVRSVPLIVPAKVAAESPAQDHTRSPYFSREGQQGQAPARSSKQPIFIDLEAEGDTKPDKETLDARVRNAEVDRERVRKHRGRLNQATTLAQAVPSATSVDPANPSAAPTPLDTGPFLCKEQEDLVDLIMTGQNVFYTGSAGCGKSTVLKAAVKRLRERGLQVDIIAPTGRAALDINGSTTWTYAGWTPDSQKKPMKVLLNAAHGTWVHKRLNATNVLILDEVSMVENLHFERLNRLLKEARNSAEAFGGVQMIVTGDSCQLPPVKPFKHCIECGRELIASSEATYVCKKHGSYRDIDKWAFRSRAWAECRFHHVNLTNIHRQSDQVFIKILQKCRLGTLPTQEDRNILLNHESETDNAIRLFSTRDEVKEMNRSRFNELKTVKKTYTCLDGFKWNEKHRHLETKAERSPTDRSLLALREHRFDAIVELKEGMLVVLLVNLDLASGLVNGSQGVIVGWEAYDPEKLPKKEKRETKDRDRNVNKPHRKGPRVGSPAGGEEEDSHTDYTSLKEKNVRAFIEHAPERFWPVVRFDNGPTRTVFADSTINELGDERPYTLISRTQIPLMAGWACSIHKSQGMTLSKVVVDLSRSFEQGQLYVALSRATSLRGLKVLGLGSQQAGNEQVREFFWDKFRVR